MNISRRYSISMCFVYGLEEKDSKSEIIFAVNVMLSLATVIWKTLQQEGGQVMPLNLALIQVSTMCSVKCFSWCVAA